MKQGVRAAALRNQTHARRITNEVQRIRENRTFRQVKAVIDRCEELGINILDCWMSEPEVRSKIGAAIAGKRERWIIQGHLGSTWQNGQYVRTRNLEQVRIAFQDLLDRMGTDYIDLGMIHFVDEKAEFRRIMEGEFIDYVKGLKAQGVIRHIGISTHNPEQLGGIAPEREELYRICEREGVGITVMKGYAGGRLFQAETSPFGVALTPVQCLHYALTRPAVASVMAGFDTPEHVDAAVAYETATEEEKDYASVLANAPHHAYSGQCTYCGHCAPCPSRIDIAMVNKLYDLAVMQEEVPATVKAHYSQLSANAGDCIQCGGCETRCPFGVRIVDRMEKTKALFGQA